MSVDNKDKNSQKAPIPVTSEKVRQEENSSQETKTHISTNHDKTRALCIILALVVVVGMLIYAYPRLSSLLGLSSQIVNSEKEIINRIEHLEDHTKKLIDEVEEVQQHETATDNQVAAEVATVQKFEERLQRLEVWQQQQGDLKVALRPEESHSTISQPAEETLKSKVQELIKHTEKLEAAQQNFKRHLQCLPEIIQAFSALRLRLQSSQPFIRELESAVRHVDKTLEFLSPSLKFLEDYATVGIPTLEQLKEEFTQIIEALKRTPQKGELGWWERYKKILENLVVVQKNSLDVPHVENSILQLSQAKLTQDDLQGALSLIEKLNFKEFEVWCAHAAARSQVKQLIPQLEAAPFSILLKKGEGNLPSSVGLALIPQHNSK
ncbi:MAG: hypothetical protein IBJ00_02865 [Alphaproteobacteria bacterium]|nr:hypothetical protein [Alphaproteobacteria bacterium]